MVLGAISVLGVVMVPGEVLAQVKKAPVSVEIRTIYATADNKGVDPKLQHLEGKLTKAFAGYGTFKGLAKHQASLSQGSSYEFSIPGGTRFIISHKGQTSNDGKLPDDLLKLELNIDKKFKSDVRASRGSTFFQAGLPHGSGILIIAITVK